jgi:NADPH-dependent ferric siderophore reductase
MTLPQGLHAHPVRVFEAVVTRVQDLSPHFRRITLAGPDLATLGVPGPTFDLRIKMLLPVPGHLLSKPGSADGLLEPGWYQDWLRLEQPGRGWIRSYTIRALRHTGQGREIDLDFVLHPAAGPGAPGSNWARAAAPGVPAVFVGPDASVITPATPLPETGINWNPGVASRVLLAGDETAVPAISAILEALPPHLSGEAFMEVPDADDFLDASTASDVNITWLGRGGERRGARLHDAMQKAFRGTAATGSTYAWVGAEAGTVKELRRFLVQGVGLDSRQSEFRGYWSLGKAGSGANGVPVAEAATVEATSTGVSAT